MNFEAGKGLPEAVAAFIVLAGVSVFVRGVWLAWRPGGWMVAGFAIAAPALFWLYGKVRKSLRQGSSH